MFDDFIRRCASIGLIRPRIAEWTTGGLSIVRRVRELCKPFVDGMAAWGEGREWDLIIITLRFRI